MKTDELSFPNRSSGYLAIAATFTAEPLETPLDFWMAELSLPLSIDFAPYDQVFQQLLDPGSQLSRNHHGVNVVLVRLEDWVRSRPESEGLEDLEESLARNAADLVDAAKEAVARSTAPLIIGLCPDSPAVRARPGGAGPRSPGSSNGSPPSWVGSRVVPAPARRL